MIAILVLPGPNPDMHGLDREVPLGLLPLGDRPMLQHMVEFLALQGVRRFEFILEHSPEKVEQALGDGTRWGCQFGYHLVFQTHQPYRSLRVMPSIAGKSWLLVHADAFPLAPLHEYSQSTKPVMFVSSDRPLNSPGTIQFPPGNWPHSLETLSPQEVTSYLTDQANAGLVEQVAAKNWIYGYTPTDLLAGQQKLLNGSFSDLMMGGVENEPGIWISRNVVVHPSTKIQAPVFIGQNSRLAQGVKIGPNVVVSGSCVIDAHTVLRNSLVVAGSYVGEKLELDNVIVCRSLLVNARIGAAVTVSDSFLLGGLTTDSEGGRLGQWLNSLVALVLIFLFLPLYLLIGLALLFRVRNVATLRAVKLPAPQDPSRWRAFNFFFLQKPGEERHLPASWPSFFWYFLPGLIAVLGGKAHLIGLPLRSAEEVEALSTDWRTLYLSGRAGLITEASVAGTDSNNELESYLHDSCYRATRNFWYDWKLFFRYLNRLIVGSVGKSGLTASVEVDSPEVANQPPKLS